MTHSEFLNVINEKVSKFNMTFEYNPVDGAICKSNFKFIEFDFNAKSIMFSYTIKSITIMNGYQTMKLMQEIAQAGEIIEVLKELAIKKGTLII
jgi:hypothetical protein